MIFGGGNPQGFFNAVKASTGLLSLINTSDSVFLRNAAGTVVGSVQYGNEANQDQSLTRFPEGGAFQLHGSISKDG